MAKKRGKLDFESPGDLDVVRTGASPIADTPAEREHISTDYDDKPNCLDAMPKEGEAQFIYGKGK